MTMYLERIIISDFKNITEARLNFSPRVNSISGNNGEGKTNLLDAIHYLSMTKSYFNTSDLYTYTFGKQQAILNGIYRDKEGLEEKISVVVRSDGAKTVKRNEKSYDRLSHHIGLIPIVMVSPSDTQLINGGAEERRRFLNSLISQVDKEYLYRVQRYNHLLQQRNKLLKAANPQQDIIETVTERMAPDALYIFKKRKEFAIHLEELSNGYYAKLCAGAESVALQYGSDLAPYEELGEEALLKLLRENFQKDLALRYTSAGIHRDDLDFTILDHPLKRCGSQGQQKSFLIALKLAQFATIKRLHGSTPILLLDDLFDKLDMQRVKYLLELVSGEGFGQIFISESNKVRLELLKEAVATDIKYFEVNSGAIKELEVV